ncbi:MAG: phosphonate metabolism protein/1,5-bisphosphokinase (PRPP-forming) PhnN [Candidatus Thiodiazotropha sp. (ex Semelilucina semeliformis)]|nr:phosphonate metabolism protein/1,5-bisphosphokinase (PRPP-forming) PhnN [Candidatus Thiodiazotropha sp. (ex Semelilucina semeliformis)]
MKKGQLFYLMGGSGVGKDSLLHYLESHLASYARVVVPRRYITRKIHTGGEPHIEITPEAFQQRVAEGGFAMQWQSHGFSYGIGTEIDRWLSDGYQVIVNGSRHYLEAARQDYPNLQPVLVTVSHKTLHERLTMRGRESHQEIEKRLQRAEALDRALMHTDLIRLSNDGPLSEAGEALLRLILSKDNPHLMALEPKTATA